jgi:hypothetical protein
MEVVNYSTSLGVIDIKRVDTTAEYIQRLINSKIFQIEKTELNFTPIDGNCYCYYTSDDSFLQLNLLYFGNTYIQYVNPLITALKGHPLKPITIHLNIDDTKAPSGQASGDGLIQLWFGEGNFDPSVIVHEISHEIHSEMIGKDQNQLYKEIGQRLDKKGYAEFLGIIEGTANYLAALYLEDSMIGRIAWMDIPHSIDQMYAYDGLPTQYDFFDRMVNSVSFAARYPVLTTKIRAQLPNFANTDQAKMPDPYLSSPILFQPLWNYRKNYSKDAYIQLYFRFLSTYNDMQSYSAFANAFIHFVEPTDQAFANYLRAEYTKRKLNITN